MVTKKVPVKTVRKPRAKAPPPSNSNFVDKAIDLIKWVDTPFKLFEVVLLVCVFGFGYFAWDSRQVILNAIISQEKLPQLKDREELIKESTALLKDTESVSVLVHKVSLVTNQRTTLFALSAKGLDKSLEGHITALFSNNPERNKAMIGMLNGEVACDKLVSNTKTSEWETKQGATFACRASIPPPVGQFAGYVSVTWANEPKDLESIKTRMNLAATEMAK